MLQIVEDVKLIFFLDLVALVVVVAEVRPKFVNVVFLFGLLSYHDFWFHFILDIIDSVLEMHLDHFPPVLYRLIYFFEGITVLTVVELGHLRKLEA